MVLPLYGAGVAWTLVYDTIYAHQVTTQAISQCELQAIRRVLACGFWMFLTLVYDTIYAHQTGNQNSAKIELNRAKIELK